MRPKLHIVSLPEPLGKHYRETFVPGGGSAHRSTARCIAPTRSFKDEVPHS